MATKRGELSIHVVYENEEEKLAEMRRWAMTAVLRAAGQSQRGRISVAFYEGERMVSHASFGEQEPEVQAAVEHTFGHDAPRLEEGVA